MVPLPKCFSLYSGSRGDMRSKAQRAFPIQLDCFSCLPTPASPALSNLSLPVSRLASCGGEITSADTEQQFHPAGRFLLGESYDITRGTAECSLLCSAAPTCVPWEGACTMSWKRSPALPQLEWLVTVSPNVKKKRVRFNLGFTYTFFLSSY